MAINYRKRNYFNDDPIVSYGLILFYKNKNNDIEFLVQQRRDTFEYMDFIRGLWKSEYHINSYLNNMTKIERDRLGNYEFQDLWDDLFIEKNSKIYRDLHGKACKKYNNIRDDIHKFLKNTYSNSESPPWGFPKGKRMHNNEDNISCAIRETEEETKINRRNFKVYPEYVFEEYFRGSNGKNYGTIYYLAELNEKITPSKIKTPDAIRKETLSEEVQDIKYDNFENSCKFLSNHRRENILLKVFNTIKCNFK
jgi:ADP-ribose pyrophosphatase YjhB (NUDIX family)